MAPEDRGIAAANLKIRADAELAELQRLRRVAARSAIAAVDELLGIIEQRHLDGEARRIRMKPAWRNLLESGGQPIPAPVLTATSTIALHERLLDWEDQLLDHAAPDPRGTPGDTGRPAAA